MNSNNYEKEQMKSKSLEGKVEELEGIIDLMKEIVFNDTNDGSKYDFKFITRSADRQLISECIF